jgi:hypothetical protein
MTIVLIWACKHILTVGFWKYGHQRRIILVRLWYQLWRPTLKQGGLVEEIQKMQGPASSPKMWSPLQLFSAQAPSWLSNPLMGHRWATQTYHNTRSTQSFLQPKRSTSKHWATKARQDWSVIVTINSRLLACKASWESSILRPNPHYERTLTFKALALNQTLRGKVHPTLIIQELQVIKYIKQHNISYQQAHEFVKLSTWWLS